MTHWLGNACFYRIGSWTMCLVLSAATLGCRSSAEAPWPIRQAVVSGAFYPAEAAELRRTVDGFLNASPLCPASGTVVGLLVPHAGYVFSGPAAGIGMQALAPDIERVFVIGTGHRVSRSGAALIRARAFQTPLGAYPTDSKIIRDLLGSGWDFFEEPEAWSQEHSVEVQVPFLQRQLPQAQLVPMLMAQADDAQIERLSAVLAAQMERYRSVIIASTDLSHYPAAREARASDLAMLAAIERLDAQGLKTLDAKLRSQGTPDLNCTVCGLAAVQTVLRVCQRLGSKTGQILHYTHSGERGGDPDHVVGYGTVVFTRGTKRSVPAEIGPEAVLNAAQQRELLSMARRSIAQALHRIRPSAQDLQIPGWLSPERAVFVTLKEAGELRGCIGTVEPRQPLHLAVSEMACAAAFTDPRFKPVHAEELDRLRIEISILSPMRRIRNPREIQMGRHGVVVRAQGRSGLFLPQVAQETGWSREHFLNELCAQKAGLPKEAWQDPKTELYVFTVQSFQE